MNGSECKNCPVNPCETMNYRGSACAAQRAKFGLGEPQTKADRIRAMSDEELAEFLNRVKAPCDCCQLAVVAGACTETLCDDAMTEWLKRPAEGKDVLSNLRALPRFAQGAVRYGSAEIGRA